MKVNISQADEVITGDAKLPRDRYKVAVVGSEAKISSAGNAMIQLDLEIVEPETIEYDGQKIAVAGKQARMWWMLSGGRLATTIEKAKLLGVEERLGLDSPELDTDDIERDCLKGLTFDMILYSQEREQRKEQTPEQKAAGQPGDPILDANGQAIKLGYNIVANQQSILGNPNWTEQAF